MLCLYYVYVMSMLCYITCYVYVMLYNMLCFITCYVYVMLYNMLCFITGYVMLYYRTYYVILYNMLCLCYVLYNKVSNSCILIGPYDLLEDRCKIDVISRRKKILFFQNGGKF